jgi:hypothetical protein
MVEPDERVRVIVHGDSVAGQIRQSDTDHCVQEYANH